MSGLLERIVRRRRASASRRLGPPAQNSVPGASHANGGPPERAGARVNGSAGVETSAAEPEAGALAARPDVGAAEPEAGALAARPDLGAAEPEAGALAARPDLGTAKPEAGALAARPDLGAAEPEAGALAARPDLGAAEPEGGEAKAAEPSVTAFGTELGAVAAESEVAEARGEPADPPVPRGSALEPTRAPVPEPVLGPEPGFRERGRIRRRARYLRRLREVQLRDIGGFVLELYRFDRERPALVQAKIAAAARTDAELRALERALGEQRSVRELREPGIGGTCDRCGAVHGSTDRFCASCGEPLRGRASATDRPSKPDPSAHR